MNCIHGQRTMGVELHLCVLSSQCRSLGSMHALLSCGHCTVQSEALLTSLQMQYACGTRALKGICMDMTEADAFARAAAAGALQQSEASDQASAWGVQ